MRHLLILTLAVSAIALSGCGTKPSSPEQTGHSRTYPNVNTDPIPRGGAVQTLPR